MRVKKCKSSVILEIVHSNRRSGKQHFRKQQKRSSRISFWKKGDDRFGPLPPTKSGDGLPVRSGDLCQQSSMTRIQGELDGFFVWSYISNLNLLAPKFHFGTVARSVYGDKSD